MNKLHKGFLKKVFEMDEDEFDDNEMAKIAKAIEVLADNTSETLANGSEGTLGKAAVIDNVKSTLGDAKAEIVDAFYDLIEDEVMSSELYKSLGEDSVLLNTGYGITDTHLILQSEKGLFWELPYNVTDEEIEFGTPHQLDVMFSRKAIDLPKKKVARVKVTA